MSTQVLVVEDAEVTRRGLRLFLEEGGLAVLEAANVEEALDLAEAHRPDAAVVDLVLPLRSGAPPDYDARAGLELVHRLKMRFPSMGVVILSAHPDQGVPLMKLVHRGRWRGIAYLLKTGDAAKVESTLALVRRGGVYVDPEVSLLAPTPQSAMLLSSLGPAEQEVIVEALGRVAWLTPRELEVLDRVAQSLGTDEIAAALGISPRTAENHVAHICDKLGLNTGAASTLRRDVLLAKIALLHRLESGPAEGM